MDQSPSIANLAAALAHLQGHLANVAKTSTNSILRNKYADLAAVRDATAGPLADAGLAVVQTAVVLEGGQPGLRTALVHTSGEWIGGTLPLKATGNKGVNEMQALGAAITYARRYGLLAILGLATDDDDGNGAGPMRTEERRTEERSLDTGGHIPGPPIGGRDLFTLIARFDDRHGAHIRRHINSWTKGKDFPARMVDWDASQVREAFEEAVRRIMELGWSVPEFVSGYTPEAAPAEEATEPAKTFSQWLDQWSVFLAAHNARIINHLHGKLAEKKPERFDATTPEGKREQLEAAWNESRAWFDAAILKYETALTTGRANGHAN
jgi:hypothetical protein